MLSQPPLFSIFKLKVKFSSLTGSITVREPKRRVHTLLTANWNGCCFGLKQTAQTLGRDACNCRECQASH
ncbi:hypothetical protein GBAR_LOCUS10570 [Geodia barretti]|uniref:Uncharacterized protein n=1 Tax=Geodia barretti TaxID=519541 RepID=A0AA35RTG3_GEOBA|nr:hypothetical protein GBAR_LOCUS10570 [Geodia barretti]